MKEEENSTFEQDFVAFDLGDRDLLDGEVLGQEGMKDGRVGNDREAR